MVGIARDDKTHNFNVFKLDKFICAEKSASRYFRYLFTRCFHDLSLPGPRVQASSTSAIIVKIYLFFLHVGYQV